MLVLMYYCKLRQKSLIVVLKGVSQVSLDFFTQWNMEIKNNECSILISIKIFSPRYFLPFRQGLVKKKRSIRYIA